MIKCYYLKKIYNILCVIVTPLTEIAEKTQNKLMIADLTENLFFLGNIVVSI